MTLTIFALFLGVSNAGWDEVFIKVRGKTRKVFKGELPEFAARYPDIVEEDHKGYYWRGGSLSKYEVEKFREPVLSPAEIRDNRKACLGEIGQVEEGDTLFYQSSALVVQAKDTLDNGLIGSNRKFYWPERTQSDFIDSCWVHFIARPLAEVSIEENDQKYSVDDQLKEGKIVGFAQGKKHKYAITLDHENRSNYVYLSGVKKTTKASDTPALPNNKEEAYFELDASAYTKDHIRVSHFTEEILPQAAELVMEGQLPEDLRYDLQHIASRNEDRQIEIHLIPWYNDGTRGEPLRLNPSDTTSNHDELNSVLGLGPITTFLSDILVGIPSVNAKAIQYVFSDSEIFDHCSNNEGQIPEYCPDSEVIRAVNSRRRTLKNAPYAEDIREAFRKARGR